MYDEIKQTLGPSQKKTAPCNFATGEIIQDRAQQMERWVEHDYSELSARQKMVSLEALNAIECLPVLGDLDCGNLLSGAERGPGVPAPGKARGQDGNTLPVVEGGYGTTMMRDANIESLYSETREQEEPATIIKASHSSVSL